MSQRSKLLAKLSAKPTPSNIRWNELKKALEHCGYDMINGTGSRRKFYNKELDLLISLHEPHPSDIVKKGCLDDVVEHLRQHNFIEKS